ncbi:hypothetical protein MLD38_032903 [Melastoma candidum]|uniref:Uncharacterized protein n=1 Tax=Melastoma candidum TaxID=119954 RepID=A0ACB9M5G6_9MYRT|nr:hypothetical protein MLD38_032903 [Melastoma candidum]
MSPRVTLSRRKALDKSKYRDGLRAVRRYIPRLEQDLELLQAQNRIRGETKTEVPGESQQFHNPGESCEPEKSVKLKEILSQAGESFDNDVEMDMDISMPSDSEDLSDIFETESESETEDKTEDGHNKLLDTFDNLPANVRDTEDFEDHLRNICTTD